MSGGTQTSTTSSAPPAQVLANYGQLTSGAESLLSQPLNQYSSPLVAGFTPDQQSAFSGVEQAQGAQTPYINAAAQEFGQATTPLWQTLPQFSASTVNQYQSPYTQDVTQSLQNIYGQQNAQQLQQVAGNATSAGAYGGDREAVAQALTAQQQQLAEAPTLAQVQQQGYTTAQGEFNTQQQQQLSAEEANSWLGSQAGFGLASLGNQAQTSALTGASALLQTGGLQQQLGQEQLNVPYEQYTAAQAYPYQQLGFLAPIIEGTGSLSGGTGATTYPGQSALSQAAGLGLTGLGLYNSGIFGNSSSSGGVAGSAAGSAAGDVQYDDAVSGSGVQYDDAKSGGRISKAIGGPVGLPALPGIGNGVLPAASSFIPQPASLGTPSSMGLNISQPDVTQTTTSSSGGSGTLGDIGALASLARLGIAVAAMARGGHVHRDDGGSTTQVPGQSTTQVPGQVNLLPQQKGIGLPAVPQVSLDHIIHPGPEIKGAGPPKAPNVPAGANNQFGIGQATSLLNEAKSIKGIGGFGNNSTASSGSDGSASGGRIGLQDGGVPVSVAAQFGGAPPTTAGALQQLYQLPLNRLQEMAVQFPPTSQQGQLVQTAIRQKQATPGAGTAQMPSQSAQPQQPQPGLGAPISGAQPQTGGTSSMGGTSQQIGGTASTMAEGGTAGGGYVTPDELDPLPVVDHSGDTVKIRYPSEGKVLDLGLPPIKGRRALASGGSSGLPSDFSLPSGYSLNTFGNESFAIAPDGSTTNLSSIPQGVPTILSSTGYWNSAGPNAAATASTTTAPTPAPAPPTPQPAPAANQAAIAAEQPVFGKPISAANGVSIPQLNQNAFSMSALQTDPLTGAPYQSGGGSGNWFAPLAQYQPSGTTTGPGGSTQFPSMQMYSPGIGGVANAFGISVPASLGGTGTTTTTPAAVTPTPPSGITPAADIGSGGGGKRGGNVSHFDDGGDVGDIPAWFTDTPPPPSAPPPSPPPPSPPPPSTPPPSPLTRGIGLPVGDVDLTADTQQFKGIGVPRGTSDSGEPSSPSAMVTADRGPSPEWLKTAPPLPGAPPPPGVSRETPDIPPTLQGIEPSLGPIVQRESGGQPYAGYTSPETLKKQGHVTDLRDAPVDKTGVPIWEGDTGPQGMSHAFGPAQIQPDTWRPIAAKLGITDWRAPGAYAAVANALHHEQGDAPWAASAPGRGIGSPSGAAGGDQVVSPSQGIGSTPAPSYALDRTAPYGGGDYTQHHGGFSLSDYAMPMLIAGLSTLGSRSPNALAEGFRAAAPYFTAGERAQSAQQSADVRQQASQQTADARQQANASNMAVRQQAAAEKSLNDSNMLQYRYDNLKQQQNAGADSLALRQQIADTKAQLDQATLSLKGYQMLKPIEGYDSKSGQQGKYSFDFDKRDYVFTPGPTVGKPPAVSTFQQMRQAYLQVHQGDEEGANNYAAKTSGFRDSAEYEREVSAMMGHLQQLPAYAAAVPEALRGAAEQMVLTSRGNSPRASAAQQQPTAQPATTQPTAAGQPAPQQPATASHPPMVQNGWRYEWSNGGYHPTTQIQ